MKETLILDKLNHVKRNLQLEPEASIKEIDALLEMEGPLSRSTRMTAFYYKGCALMYGERYRELMSIAMSVKAISEKLQDYENMGRSYNLLGVASLNLNDYFNAINYYKKGYTLFRSLKDDRMTAILALNLSDALAAVEIYETAKDYAFITIDHAIQCEYQRLTAKAFLRLANISILTKDFHNAQLFSDHAKQYIAEDSQPLDSFYYEMTQTKNAIHSNNLQQGARHLQRAESSIKHLPFHRGRILFALIYSDYKELSGELREGEQKLLEALELCKKIDHEKLEIDISTRLIALYRKMDQPQKEIRFLRRKMDLQSRMNHNILKYDVIKDFIESRNNYDAFVSLIKENNELKKETGYRKILTEKERFYNKEFEKIMESPSLSNILSAMEEALKSIHSDISYGIYQSNPQGECIHLQPEKSPLKISSAGLKWILEKARKIPASNKENVEYRYFPIELPSSIALVSANRYGHTLLIVIEDFQLIDLPEYMESFLKKVMFQGLSTLASVREQDSHSRWSQVLNHTSLTKREKEIVKYVCLGLNNREIADKIHVSNYTVRNQLSGIFQKLGVSNRFQLISKLLHITHRDLAPEGSRP